MAHLYRLYDGDLRATFEALDAAISQLLGTSADGAGAPLSLRDVAPFLTGWARDGACAHIENDGLSGLMQIVPTYGDTPFTRLMVQSEILRTKNDATGRDFVNQLLRFGYIREHPEQLKGSRGRPATQYVITGATRMLAGTAYARSTTEA